MSLPRMMHADVQFQIYRLEQMAMGGALAFDADEIRSACHLIRTLATELDATAAPVVVGEDMVERAAREMERGRQPHWTDEQFEVWWNRDPFFCEQKTAWHCFAGTRKEKVLWEARNALTAALAGD